MDPRLEADYSLNHQPIELAAAADIGGREVHVLLVYVLGLHEEARSNEPAGAELRAVDTGFVGVALQLGAYGVVLRETPANLLFKSIRRVRAGEFWVNRETVADLVHALSSGANAAPPAPLNAPRAFALSPRELEIVSAVASGYTDRQMAEKLAVAEETIRGYLDAILQKTGVANRLELALFAIHHRLTHAAR